MYKIGEEELIVCPYNRYHVVSKLRIQKHIWKCKKNYPDIQLATCFYNYSHRLKPEDMLKHYETCSQKNKLEGARYYEPPKHTSAAGCVTNDSLGNNFPDINTKIQFLYKIPNEQTGWINNQELPSNCDLEDSLFKKTESSDENDSSDDNLEPLPLPKTYSKAFSCKNEHPVFESVLDKESDLEEIEFLHSTGIGRGKTMLSKSATSQASGDKNTVYSDISTKKKNCKIFSEDILSHCNESVTSSMLDDTTTLKSEDIIFNESHNNDYDDSDNDNFLLKSSKKYTKL